jgi:predicted transcriptional regulator
LAYYLKILEREDKIRSERDGMYKRFYPTKGKISRDVLELSEVQKNIYQLIKDNLGISQKDIQTQLGISQQRMNYHVQLMSNARIIKVERVGKGTKCFVIDDNA